MNQPKANVEDRVSQIIQDIEQNIRDNTDTFVADGRGRHHKAIKSLITEQATRARVEELNSLAANYTRHYKYKGNLAALIKHRIATLTKNSNDKEGK